MQDGAWLKSSCVHNLKFRKLNNLGLVQFLVMFWNMSQTLHCVKKLDYLRNCKSEISTFCDAVEDHCLFAMKIVHHYANNCFDWLIYGHQSVNPSRKAISVLSCKYKRFTFVHPVMSHHHLPLYRIIPKTRKGMLS